MIVEIGAFALMLALMLALALSVAQVGLSVAGRIRRSGSLAAAGEGAALGAFLAVAAAFAVLMYAFVGSDFSVANVAANSHSQKPLLYRVAATWGSHEGSMRCCQSNGNLSPPGAGALSRQLSRVRLGAIFAALTR